MATEDFNLIYSGASFQADLLRSLLERKGIQAILKDEFLGRMVPYAVPEGVKILVPSTDVDNARKIVEDFIKDGASSDEQQRADKREATTVYPFIIRLAAIAFLLTAMIKLLATH